MSRLLGPFSQLVTMRDLPRKGPLSDDQLEVIPNAGILTANGRITAFGPYEQMAQRNPDEVWELEYPCVALPGFIDSHTHICWSGSRAQDYSRRLSGASYQEIAAQGGGILTTVKATREADRRQTIDNIVKRAGSAMRQGVTCCEVKTGYGLSVDSEMSLLESIAAAKGKTPSHLVATCLAAHTVPPEADSAEAYLDDLITHLLPLVHERGLASRVDIFVEEHAFSVEQARRYLLAAKQLGFAVTVHGDQFTSGGAKLAVEVGGVSVDHLEVINDQDLEMLAASSTAACVLPGASLGLGIPYAPARKLLDKGAQLVIASDWNPGSAPMGQLLTQAALLGNAERLTTAETLAAITCRAAAVLGLQDHGIIAVENRANLALFPTDNYREILYQQGSLQPNAVVVNGQTHSFHQ